MKDPIFLRRSDILPLSEAVYWKDLLYQVTKIGLELEVAPPKGCQRPVFEAAISEQLMPSGTLNSLGKNGILDVCKEHCGVEVRIIGRQPHFRALYKQLNTIMQVLLQQGARPRSTCGLHFHLLTPGLAEPVPEIILANLWNLVRKYAPELRFLTSGGDSLNALCRRRNYTSHLEMVRYSPAVLHMREIQKCLRESKLVPEHNNFFNLKHILFSESGLISDFHLEFRFPDADLSPISVSAKTFLFLALLLKAVDLSQYGVIHVGKIRPWRRKVWLLDILSNNEGKLATSNTAALTPELLQELSEGCFELLNLLAPVFNRFPYNPSLDILHSLSEKPISLLRCDKLDWPDIEDLLLSQIHLNDLNLDETDLKLMQIIELGEWTRLSSLESWKNTVSRQLYLNEQDFEKRLTHLTELRGLHWDPGLGTCLFLN